VAVDRITRPAGTTVSCDRYGTGPPLVLVHGGFSDHITNWREVKPMLRVNDVRALSRYRFEADRYRSLNRPVQLLIGTESPRDIYVTDALAAVLPDVRIVELDHQAHESMTTAPQQFVEAISRFLLE
jgi:pimeloyl-ACP methyl ester carboxylesterase